MSVFGTYMFVIVLRNVFVFQQWQQSLKGYALEIQQRTE